MSMSITVYIAYGVPTIDDSSEVLCELLDKTGLGKSTCPYDTVFLDFDYLNPIVIHIKKYIKHVYMPNIIELDLTELAPPTIDEANAFKEFLKDNKIEYKGNPKWLWFCQYG